MEMDDNKIIKIGFVWFCVLVVVGVLNKAVGRRSLGFILNCVCFISSWPGGIHSYKLSLGVGSSSSHPMVV